MSEKESNKNSELLKPENMIRLYAMGAFPMADEVTGEIKWYMPESRAIIPLEDYNIPRSLRKFLNDHQFEVKYDTDFYDVVRQCASRDKTWISAELISAYRKLEKLGFIHTVEAWSGDKLVGGLYGVSYKGAFFGESMFSLVSQASKVALVNLIRHLNDQGFLLLDVQYLTPHLEMFGAMEISFEEYNDLLLKAYQFDCKF